MMAHACEKPVEVTGPAEFGRLFDVSRETCARLEFYANLLKRWQEAINLVAPNTLDQVWHRHFTDSAQLFAYIPADARHLIDVGSGAGFPGLVLAILSSENRSSGGPHAGLNVTLVESDTRKAAFLRDVARQAGIAVDIMSTRIESITKSANLVPADVITARALAPLTKLFALVEPLFQPQTVALFLKGKSVSDEVEAARKVWDFDLELVASLTDAEARIAVIRQLELKKEADPDVR